MSLSIKSVLDESFLSMHDPHHLTTAQKNKIRMKAEKEAAKASAVKRDSAAKVAKAADKAAHKEKTDKFHEKLGHSDIPEAFGQTFPDSEPYEYLAQKHKNLHQSGELMGHLNKASKKAGFKSFDHHIKTMRERVLRG